MGEAIDKTGVGGVTDHASKRDLRKAMSDNIAFALIVYTGLQIFMTVHAMKQGISSIAPYFALIVLVAAIIPACRWFERRWLDLSDDEAADPAMKGAFRRDLALLWGLAIGLPVLLTALLKVAFAALG